MMRAILNLEFNGFNLLFFIACIRNSDLNTIHSMTHNELRQHHRKQRADISQIDQSRAAASLCTRIIKLLVYQQSNHIAVYFAVSGEISLDPVINHALTAGKQIYLPSLDQKSLRFSAYCHSQKMCINKFKLPEPDVNPEDRLHPHELDLVFVPLVAFDAACNRIGMGGGFYDRSFMFRQQSLCKPTLIGVAHDSQKVDQLIPEAWDVRLDQIITDRGVYG